MTSSTNWDEMEKAESGAALSESNNEEITFRSKTLKNIPSNYFDAHEKIKESGKTPLLLTAYMIVALQEKLERDGAL